MPSKYDEAKAAFEDATGLTIVTKRFGKCQEVVRYELDAQNPSRPPTAITCGLDLKAREERRGLNVRVSGECPEGHSFERVGYVDPADEGEVP